MMGRREGGQGQFSIRLISTRWFHSPRAYDPPLYSFRGWNDVSGGRHQEQIQMITTAIGRPTHTAAPSAMTISLSRP